MILPYVFMQHVFYIICSINVFPCTDITVPSLSSCRFCHSLVWGVMYHQTYRWCCIHDIIPERWENLESQNSSNLRRKLKKKISTLMTFVLNPLNRELIAVTLIILIKMMNNHLLLLLTQTNWRTVWPAKFAPHFVSFEASIISRIPSKR
jgi:hypothetical protein